jgi:hypothetical protein
MSDLAAGTPKQRKGAPRTVWRRLRLVPLAVAALAMAVGLWTGLARLGVPVPGGPPALAAWHGPFMIAGFLGTVISLERAVALGRWWGYLAPALSALGALALTADAPRSAALAFLLASAVLFLASLVMTVRQFALFAVMLTVAAAAWGLGTVLWLAGSSLPVAVGWWLDFLILTIMAERLELSRMLNPPPVSQLVFAGAVALVIVGTIRGELAEAAAPFTGAGLLACAAWLLHHDIARRTIRQTGQPRFSAASILIGHLWLGAAGLLLLIAPPATAAFSYDAAVHALAIGSVLSMVFGHAPIILPAVTGWRVKYHPAAYGALALLHASLLLRILGDLLIWIDARTASGILTVLALASYAAILIVVSRSRFA